MPKAVKPTPVTAFTPERTYVRTPCELFRELADHAEPAKHLKDNQTFGVATILQLAFSKVTLDLPTGAPPYKADPSPADMTLQRFDAAVKVLGNLLPSSRIPSVQKERQFIALLESVSEKDAEIIIAAKDKQLTQLYPHITPELVRSAIPGLI